MCQYTNKFLILYDKENFQIYLVGKTSRTNLQSDINMRSLNFQTLQTHKSPTSMKYKIKVIYDHVQVQTRPLLHK